MIGNRVSHYEILDKLGEGGMGIVYRARDTRLNRTVALKFLLAESIGGEEARRRFLREAQAAAALDHRNICTVYEIDEEDGQIFIAMAHVAGQNLRRMIFDGPLPVDDARRIAVQMARGLDAAHSGGVVHRDIKSANVMVTPEGHVKIMDFGLAKIPGATQISESAVVVGTAAYMSPEQARGDDIDHRTDIWSTGVCMYEMLAGRVPFTGNFAPAVIYGVLNEDPVPLSELRPGVPVDLERVIVKSLSKDRDERQQSAAELLEDLESPEKIAGRGWSSTVTQPSVAVLPFADLSPKQDQEYFCDGMAEEITNALTQLEGIRVAARRSAFAFKGRTDDAREIGKRLGVKALLGGSVRKAGNKLRIQAHLVNSADGYQLWSERYDRELEDVFAIQDEIAQRIVDALKVELSDKEKEALRKVPTTSVRAYDIYLRGRMYFYQSKREGIQYAREMFSKAIELDPEFALAYAGMSDCQSYLYLYFDHSEENLDGAVSASRKALELDPDLAEAHASRGFALGMRRQYAEAEQEFEKAIELNPKLFEAYYFYGRTCFAQGKLEKAANLYERACLVNPDDYQAPSMAAFTYRTLNLPDKAKAADERSLLNIKKSLEMNPDDARALYLGSNVYLSIGEEKKGREWMERALALSPDDPYNVYGAACFYSRLGEIDKAVHYLEKAVDEGFSHWEWAEKDSDLESIRDHPRFREIMSELEHGN